MKNMKQILALFLSCSLLVAGTPRGFAYQADPSAAQPPAQAAQQTSDELQQLVAPIALYPDALVAQILAASTYPTQVVEADRWMQSHSNLRGEELAKEVDKQDWDPSVKAMTQFPSVLQNMDKNLSWASSLGEAYLNQPQDVTDAVQTLREQARKAGHLQSNEQENVATQGNTIIIEPTDPQVVYVPAYDPWVVYGALSLPTQAGIRCPEFFGEAWGSPSVSGLESVSSEDLGGAGATGDTTGMAVGHFPTVTPGSRIVETLVTTGFITVISATVTSVTAVSTAAADSTALPVFTASQGHAPARLVALSMAEMSEAFPPAGGRAFMEVAMAAVDGIDSRIYAGLEVVEDFKKL